MIKEQVLCVFDVIMKYLEGGGYVVIAKKDIQDNLQQTLTQSQTDMCMNTLQMNEFIKIRYTDSEVYCVTVLPKGVIEYDRRKEEKKALEAQQRAKEEAAKKEAESSSQKPTDNEIRKEVVSVLPDFNMKKMILTCGLSGFAGAFIAGLIWLIIALATRG